MSSKNHRLVAVCGALMLLFTVAVAMRSSVASTTQPAPAPKAQVVKTVEVPPVVVQKADDDGCQGTN
jgi:hypothetical protein